MSIFAKRLLFSAGLLVIWFGFITMGNELSRIVVSGLAGWYVGGLIFEASVKVFPNE